MGMGEFVSCTRTQALIDQQLLTYISLVHVQYVIVQYNSYFIMRVAVCSVSLMNPCIGIRT